LGDRQIGYFLKRWGEACPTSRSIPWICGPPRRRIQSCSRKRNGGTSCIPSFSAAREHDGQQVVLID
jgi:hypothetical protein